MEDNNIYCQICGRQPAKEITFKAHKGFLIFRQESEISGIFCRDHALEAYAAARGESLKGMWFSPGSLVLGTLRSFWDSAKLLGLPDEVKDKPWMIHKIGCPHCNQALWSSAGLVDCEVCKNTFIVLSCHCCGKIHTKISSDPPDVISLHCQSCNRESLPPLPARNWPALLFAQSLTEISAKIASADGSVDQREREVFLSSIDSLGTFQSSTLKYLNDYFDSCLVGSSQNLFDDCVSQCSSDFIVLLFGVAKCIAEADGILHQGEIEAIHIFGPGHRLL